ncbi:exodeoxyribonuclease VII large subunit [bacterium]|nr:exodeoxyribonuclease VII large subunit [bacterium]
MQVREIVNIKNISPEKIFTVSEFLEFLNNILTPCQATIKGEVGERIDSYPGYTFFNLLDKKKSILKCFAFKEVISGLGIPLEPGMEIKVTGYPEIRKNRGELKFQIQRIELIGEGVLKKQYEILKKRLEAAGYFAPERKKPIPEFCENIGLITSEYGKGAKKDFLTHLGNFGFKVFFYDVRVEGSFSLYEIIEAIHWFNTNLPYIDVLVLTRGGGDWESLSPFNSEEIVKTIFASKIPIITGIGHENDQTLADLAADFRASTPTHAAKVLTDSWKLASINLNEFEKNLNSSINRRFKIIKEKIAFFERNLTCILKKEILSKQKRLDDLIRNLNRGFQTYFKEFEILEKEFKKNLFKIKVLIRNEKAEIIRLLETLVKHKNRWERKVEKLLRQQEEKLSLSSPSLRLKQGYTITSDEFGKIIKDPRELKISQIIKTRFYKGQVFSRIKKIK